MSAPEATEDLGGMMLLLSMVREFSAGIHLLEVVDKLGGIIMTHGIL